MIVETKQFALIYNEYELDSTAMADWVEKHVEPYFDYYFSVQFYYDLGENLSADLFHLHMLIDADLPEHGVSPEEAHVRYFWTDHLGRSGFHYDYITTQNEDEYLTIITDRLDNIYRIIAEGNNAPKINDR